MKTRLFPTLALGLLALLAFAGPASATGLPETPDLSADLSLLPCQSYLQDRDGDGEAEWWTNCGTPPCGCACPVVGAGVVVEAAEQERGAWVATSGCQTAYGTMTDEADGRKVPVDPFVWTWGFPEFETA